jgi:OHCU decarboxylase
VTALEALNTLPAEEAEARFLSCCGSSEWARRMTASRPFSSIESLSAAADRTWRELPKEDWLEAFAAHPAVGASDLNPPNSDRSSAWARQEQSGPRGANPATLAELSRLNRDYADRFGRVFLVCATGKSADEMLALGRQRLENDPETELAIAAEEQRKITRLRLEKLLSPTEQ